MLSLPLKRKNACSSVFEYSTAPFLVAVVLATCHLFIPQIHGAILPANLPITFALEVNEIQF